MAECTRHMLLLEQQKAGFTDKVAGASPLTRHVVPLFAHIHERSQQALNPLRNPPLHPDKELQAAIPVVGHPQFTSQTNIKMTTLRRQSAFNVHQNAGLVSLPASGGFPLRFRRLAVHHMVSLRTRLLLNCSPKSSGQRKDRHFPTTDHLKPPTAGSCSVLQTHRQLLESLF